MLLRFAIISILFIANLFCYANTPLRVELYKKAHLVPVYIANIDEENSKISPSYLETLHRILCFDITHSGYAISRTKEEALEKFFQNKDTYTAFNPTQWMQEGIYFVIKGTVRNNKLDVFSLHTKTPSLKRFEGIPLSGDLLLDRKQIHKLADALIKDLFKAQGIASTKILYSVQVENPFPNKENWHAEIWQCDYDGGNPHQITYEHNYCITPVLFPKNSTPGNEHFFYVNYKNGQPKIYISSLRNRTGKPFLNLRGNQLLPTISKNKDKIAFISDAGGRADLFLQAMNSREQLEGKPRQLFSYPRSTQASPTFSPDGSKIAFVSDKDGSPRIYVIPSTIEKRIEPTLITKLNRENTCPSWSADGKKIAYSAKTNGVRQIWVYFTESGKEEQVTTGPGNKENPCFAKDSMHLVFNSTDPGSSQLFLINLNQREPVQITSGPGKKHYPAWGDS